jgi:hypothetical protein
VLKWPRYYSALALASKNELELLVISSYNVLMGNVLIEVVALTITPWVVERNEGHHKPFKLLSSKYFASNGSCESSRAWPSKSIVFLGENLPKGDTKWSSQLACCEI